MQVRPRRGSENAWLVKPVAGPNLRDRCPAHRRPNCSRSTEHRGGDLFSSYCPRDAPSPQGSIYHEKQASASWWLRPPENPHFLDHTTTSAVQGHRDTTLGQGSAGQSSRRSV